MTANLGTQELNSELLQKKFETILDMEEDLVVILNKAGLITKINSNGALALEFKEEDLLNRHIVDLIASKHKVETMKAFNDIIAGKPGRAFETRSEEHTSELQSLRHLVCR